MTSVSPIPEGFTTLTPYLTCADAASAIEFYVRAFGATELVRIPTEDGRVMHATLKIGNAMLMLTDEMPEWGTLGPNALGGSPVGIHMYTDDVDAAFEKAVAAGCEVIMPLENTFWGERFSMVQDPYGHKWSLSMCIAEVSEAEMIEASKQVDLNGEGTPDAD